MAKSIDEILRNMNEVLEESANLPFSNGKKVVDVGHILELMNDIKQSLPDEVRQAKAIVQDRASIISTAEREADSIIHRAEERVKLMVSDSEVVKASKAKATEIITNAQQQSRALRKQVAEYSDNVLRQSEEILTKNAKDIREVRVNIQRGPSKPRSEQ